MLHLQPVPPNLPASQPYAEAVARLASVRHALRLVEPSGGGPAADIPDDAAIAAAWDRANPATQRKFDKRSGRVVGATAAGLEALLAQQQDGREPHREASQKLLDEIRRELTEIARVILD